MLSVPLFSIKGPHLLNAVHPLPRVQNKIRNSPVVNSSCPDWVHRVSQSPCTARLNLRISAVTLAVFHASYIVRTFQVPMFKVFLVERRVIGIVAYFRFSPQHVIRPGKQCRPCLFQDGSIVFICCACFCSVVFFTRWGCRPHGRPSPFLRPG